jgi:hypothetical protein
MASDVQGSHWYGSTHAPRLVQKVIISGCDYEANSTPLCHSDQGAGRVRRGWNQEDGMSDADQLEVTSGGRTRQAGLGAGAQLCAATRVMLCGG